MDEKVCRLKFCIKILWKLWLPDDIIDHMIKIYPFFIFSEEQPKNVTQTNPNIGQAIYWIDKVLIAFLIQISTEYNSSIIETLSYI